ncbi:ABC transporter ATP-binding protein [Pseudoflavonifractor sp. 524-17]|uniref:ABC transporter ATP-binding protein n=1 Tax=Pseudoflavonifractor sp. 524-17 TaxID=2304577 RepID=UPI00137A806C|nr:ABC transporter ATP-binding protein [Pseudoflavonifractor sp. 524-17]NCE64689.1 ABC transporter ATP-binding protein [Pseudoflavonifractor sp. 524-17]
MEQRQPIVTLDRAEKRYRGGPTVLGPLSLEVYAGEILGIRGPNGAGKSTLLKLLAGVLRPDGGTCRYGADLDRQVGYVPQEVALYDSLTGLENLRFWGRVYGLPRKAIAARSRWLLERLDLTAKAKAPVSAYSGGMRRRLHLATALMITPRLLLLDEPTVGADAPSAELILGILTHLRERGCGVVFISHQHGELERVSTRILTLEKGVISQSEGDAAP